MAKGRLLRSPRPLKVSKIIILGGTDLIYLPRSLGNAHILIAGRNQAAAERIIATFPKAENSKFEFVQCDASLIENVVAVATDVRSRIGGTLNYLVMSQGILNNNGQEPTSEGIEITMSLNFYSRWKVSTSVSQEERASLTMSL